MTNQEAFDRATIVYDTLTVGEDVTIKYNSKNVEWIIKAAEALEKQIPKKPKHPNGCVGAYCPQCNSFVGDRVITCYQYCKSCGQAIDWSGE